MKNQTPRIKRIEKLTRHQIGKNLRKQRYRANLSQTHLAALTKLELSTIHRIETAKTDTNLSTIARLRKTLRCTWPQLLRGV